MEEQRHPPERLRRLPSWLLSRAAQRGDRAVSARLTQAGARKYHFSVLLALDEAGAASQAEIGRRLALDRSDLHAVLNELEEQGLVVRAPDAQDRRRNTVSLTAAGRRKLVKLDALVTEAQDELLKPLSAADRRALVRILAKLAG
jgi:DNA-binding MarR family transcriptional regulator